MLHVKGRRGKDPWAKFINMNIKRKPHPSFWDLLSILHIKEIKERILNIIKSIMKTIQRTVKSSENERNTDPHKLSGICYQVFTCQRNKTQ